MPNTPTGTQPHRPDPPPYLGDLLLIVVQHWWLLLVLALVGAVAGGIVLRFQTKFSYVQSGRFEVYGVHEQRPSLFTEYAEYMASPEFMAEINASLTRPSERKALTKIDLPSVIRFYVAANNPFVSLKVETPDLNLTASLTTSTFTSYLDWLHHLVMDERDRLEVIVQLGRSEAARRLDEIRKAAGETDPEVLLERVRSLYKVRETIMTTYLSAEKPDEQAMRARLKVVDDELAGLNMAEARSAGSELTVALAAYEKSITELSVIEERLLKLRLAVRRLELDMAKSPLVTTPVKEVAVGGSRIGRVLSFAMLGVAVGVFLALLRYAIRQAAARMA